ncbi:MAG: hypothetical protein ACRDZ8_12860 [Acidimicrobiales bacterium]
MPRVLYIVGGPPRVGKSALGQRIMTRRGVPWLSTDILSTVLGTVVREINELDCGLNDPVPFAEMMYPFLERAANAALAQSATFLVEGVQWLPRHVTRLTVALDGVSVRACFLGHATYSSDDLASYRGVNRWHDAASAEEREGIPRWIRRWSEDLRAECDGLGQPYLDLGEMGFHGVMAAAEAVLMQDR